MRRTITSTVVALLLALGLAGAVTQPAQALVDDPHALVAGAGKKWFSGNLLSMWGLNCSNAILGSSYSEIMIQGYADYGGAPSGGAPKVNETFYAVINLSEPGIPCGSGISIPELRLRLPANMQIDTQKPIRCFVTPRFQNGYEETTNAGNWVIEAIRDAHGNPLTGPWCRQNPYQVDQFTWSIGTPAMVNGTMHQVFVPIRSTTTQSNTALQWEVRDPVTYEGMQLSEARMWVFPANADPGSTGFFFPDKPVIPYWAQGVPPGSENRAEFFMNLYTGGQSGYVCFEVRNKSNNSLVWSCNMDPGFNGTVTAGMGVVQLLPTGAVKGPNGGYAPFAFDPPEYDKDYTVQWFFKDSQNGSIMRAQSPKIDFHSLAGPDGDGDGVIDQADQCPATKGTKDNNGCPPALPPDTDGDGVVGVADKCPDVPGQGSLDGCPPATGPTQPPAQPPVATVKTVKVPAKLRGASGLKSKTPKVCKLQGKGKQRKVVVLKKGKCKLVGIKKGERIRVKFKVTK